MEYGCHTWAGAPNCYLELLDKLQKRICRTTDPSLFVSLEPLIDRHFGKYSSELLNWLHFLILEGGLVIILMIA